MTDKANDSKTEVGLTVFIPKERSKKETRVSATCSSVKSYRKNGLEVLIEKGAGEYSSILDSEYEAVGATIVDSFSEGCKKADLVLAINPPSEESQIKSLKKDLVWVSTLIPQLDEEAVEGFKKAGAISFSLNLLPRTTRAQSMDVLSSQANLAGYKAVLMAADRLGKIFPLMMTPAGTISPAKVVILGIGVAGLQAIATAQRLGAQVEASDIRLATKEQAESLGAKFIDVPGMEDFQDEKGYAKEVTPEFLAKQREEVAKKIAQADVVITTALVPGKKAPVLVTKEVVKSMKKGSVIVDMAALMGGNCELTKPDEIAEVDGVTIVGETNIPALLPTNASEVFSKNVQNFLGELLKDGKIEIDLENDIIKECLFTKGGQVVNEQYKK